MYSPNAREQVDCQATGMNNAVFLHLHGPANKKVLFIIPELSSIYPNNVDDSQEVDIIHPPLGVLYISSYCKAKGYKTFIVDQMFGPRYSDDDIIALIRNEKIEVVGISCTMTAVFNIAYRYAELCKTAGCITVMGGAHISATVESTASLNAIDVAIYGEGEETWVELLERINNRQSIQGIAGIAYRNNDGKVIIEDRRKLIVSRFYSVSRLRRD